MKKNFAAGIKKKLYSDIVMRANELGITGVDFEDITYTWFIRLIAIRFMDVNNFFPEGRVLTLDKDNTDIFIFKCSELGRILPGFFEKTDKIAEELLSLSCLDKDSVIYKILNDIDESEFDLNKNGKVEIIGWLYQNYNSDAKAEVFAMLKNNIKIDRKHIPAATQLFTPKWIVKYMVENSINDVNNIRVIDPCMGSGHILVYVFDYLYERYIKAGYSKEEAVRTIIENNIYGIDIDKRAYNLTYFAIMMKAWQYDKSIFSKNIDTGLCYIKDDNCSNYSESFFECFSEHADIAKKLINEFKNAECYGSLMKLNITFEECSKLYFVCNCLQECTEKKRFMHTLKSALILLNKYDVVITNPPYMGKKSINKELGEYLEKYYEAGKSEMYAAFMLKCKDMCKVNGYVSMITIHSWMFISSFEKLRKEILNNMIIVNMLHLGAGTFEDLNSFNALATAFVLKNQVNNEYVSEFIRLTEYHSLEEKKNHFYDKDNRYYLSQNSFNSIPGSPIIYWISSNAASAFYKGDPLRVHCKPRQGMATANNDMFVRCWYEVKFEDICFNAMSNKDAELSKAKWFPYNKGGKFRKWYGMNIYVVDWEDGGKRLKEYDGAVLRNKEYYFKSGLTWSLFGFENFSIRYKENGFLFDVSGSSMFPDEDKIYYILAFLASKVSFMYLSILAPTVNFQVGNIGDLPLIICDDIKSEVECLAKECIEISKEEWNEKEISWNYENPPFLNKKYRTIEEAYITWSECALKRYYKLKENEEKINKLFIHGYGLENDLDCFVNERDIAIKKPDKKSAVLHFISYVTGVIFGRYKLDASFEAVNDNIVIINGGKENDIVDLFENVIATIFGYENVEENLNFIANIINDDSKCDCRKVIREYYSKQFFIDHCRKYNKRPIYWMIDSGKKKAFRAFIYVHKYENNILDKIYKKYILDAKNICTGSKLYEIENFESKLKVLADINYDIDYDKGIVNNYNMIQMDRDGNHLEILAKIP